MNENMSSTDSKLRAFVAAPVFVVAGLLVGPAGWLAFVLYALGVVMLATSVVGTCPLYLLFGLRTCPLQQVTTPTAERTSSR